MTILNTELTTAEAIAHRELGERARALGALQAIIGAPAEATLYCKMRAMLELAEARLDEGDLEAAQASFRTAQDVAEQELTGAGARAWLARTGTLVALALGDLERAARWAAQVDDPFWAHVSSARVGLAAGDRTEARAALERAVPRCTRHEVVLGLLRARAVDDREEAMKLASQAVDLAAGEGLLQTVASEGPEATELAERAAWRAPEQWIDRLRRAASERRGSPRPVELVEQLTERERDVLRFLPSRLTVHEIADELSVSVNTLKFHLKIIYRKLGVSSRAEAAEVARRMTFGVAVHTDR
jgi:LuxR family maltose regulon positive regulatory protein